MQKTFWQAQESSEKTRRVSSVHWAQRGDKLTPHDLAVIDEAIEIVAPIPKSSTLKLIAIL